MLFTSITFCIFFILVYIIYWSIPKQKGKEIWLLIASIIFYGSWSFGFLFHFLFFIGLNYFFIKKLYTVQSKKIVTIAIVINLFNLGVFKYFYFFTNIFANLSGMSNLLELEKSSTFKIILPLAISFYTFQMLAYIIDVYRRKETKIISLFDFALFILFFPQLIAGPIMRSFDFLPEMKNIKAKPEYISPGLSYIALGVLKKVLLADNIALVIDPIWNNVDSYNWVTLLLASHAFTWQIYCDFSGYTDIARGCAFLLGFKIPENFSSPFLATPRERWTRWHITLSTWLKDYIYIPLGGNRGSVLRTSFNQILTFTLGGLWHGANLTYILWGFYHGCMIVIENLFVKWNFVFKKQTKYSTVLEMVYSYHIFVIGAIMFRVNTLSDLGIVFRSFFSIEAGNSFSQNEYNTLTGLCLVALLIQILQYSEKIPEFFQKRKVFFITLSYIFLLYLISLFSRSGKEFIYFTF
jgi:alginate O-acetyltransferase complex protein AlgI